MIRSPRRRQQARNLAGVGVLGSAVMLAVSIVAVLGVGTPAVHALAASGAVTLTPVAGGAPTDIGSAAEFQLEPPSGAACPGAVPDGYQFQTFVVASSVDTSTLTYNPFGPVMSAGTFGAPMYATDGQSAANLSPSTTPLGLIDGIPVVSFAVYSPGNIPAGQYKIGIACSKAGQTVSFWQSLINVLAAAGDSPAGFTWSLDTTPSPTTTTTTIAPTTTTTVQNTTTTVRTNATTTTVFGTTTTTVAGGATSTTAGGTTTTTAVSNGTTTTARVASQSPNLSSPGGSSGTLATTGASPWPILMWGVLLLVLGRVVILLARPVRVRQHGSR